MAVWAAAAVGIIVAGLVYSYWRQVSYSIIAAVSCGAVFAVTLISAGSGPFLISDAMNELEFRPNDLTDPSRAYTVLTSMYTHADVFHIFFNIIGLAFIGTVFEQRVGSRPFIILYLLTGLAGTLVFAVAHWDTPLIAVVGASGAISGVLGAFARLFPNERMSMILFFFPLPPMPIWIIVGIFVLLQTVFFYGGSNIAVEAHLGGLVAGIVLAPYIVRMPLHRRVKRMVSQSALRRLATTPELKGIMRRIEEEEIPDVRSAWIESYLSKARCPYCGSRILVRKDGIQCERGHLL